MSLPADMARCAGIDGVHKCITCARRHQLAVDEARSPDRWFSHMSPAVQDGRCVFWLETEAPTAEELEYAGQTRLLP